MARHYPNKIIFMIARGYDLQTYPAYMTAADGTWFTAHADITEWKHALDGTPTTYEATVRSENPNMEFWAYQIDLSMFTFDARVPSMPESWFIHVSNACTTIYQPISEDQNPNPVTQRFDMNPGDRFKFGIYNSTRYMLNLKDAGLRAWLKAQLLQVNNQYGGYQYLFLDEHADNARSALGWSWPRNRFPNGIPRFEEYGGVDDIVGPNGDTFNIAFENKYQADLITWFTELRAHFAAAGKRVLPNFGAGLYYDDNGAWSTGSMCRQAAVAAGGGYAEFCVYPYSVMVYFPWYQDYFWAGCQSVYNAGGIMSITGDWGKYYNTDNVGIEESPDSRDLPALSATERRAQMWRLAFYYLSRNLESQTGAACWYDVTEWSSINPTSPGWRPEYSSAYARDRGEWLDAVAIDLGVPKENDGHGGLTYHYQDSPNNQLPSKTATIYGRTYTNGFILLRCRDTGETNQVGDSSAITVPLPPGGPWYRVKADGSTIQLTGTTIGVRMLEGIMLSGTPSGSPPPPPPPPPPTVSGPVISENTSGTYIATYTGVQETTLLQADPTTSQSGLTYLDVKKFGAGQWAHALIKFTGLSNLPSNAVITNVTLGFYQFGPPPTGAQTMDVRRVLRAWVNGQATWNQYATGQAWTTAGGTSAGSDRVATPSGTFSNLVVGTGWVTLAQNSGGLISDVQNWVNGSLINNGWHLERADAADDATWRNYYSSEETQTDVRPYLNIVYTVPTPQANVWTSVRTGNWLDPTVWDHGDGSTPAAGNRAIIAAGHTVTLTSNIVLGDTPPASNFYVLSVYGLLELNGYTLYASGSVACYP